MLKFRDFTNRDYKTVAKYFSACCYGLCDYSLGVMLMWNNFFKYKISEYNNTLIVYVNYGDSVWFLLPVGSDFNGALQKIEEYAVYNEIPLKFTCVPDNYAKILENRYNGNAQIDFKRTWSDYIYDINEIRTFTGKKFSGQRNHINKFKKLNPIFKFNPITKKSKPKLIDFLNEYKKEHKDMKRVEKDEFNNTLLLLDVFDNEKFVGGYITVGKEIASLTIGEICGETLIIHVEKGLRKFQGVYPTTFNTFVNYVKGDKVLYVNREDDAGDIGLRTSKMQYHPIRLASKNYVVPKSPMQGITHPYIKGKRITLSKITKKDAETYYKLCVLKKNNKYYGYDYTKDFKEVTVDTFYNLQKRDFKMGFNMCLAIRLKKQLIGEVIFYNFTYNNTVEIGVRLFKKYQNKGYGVEAITLAKNYAETLLNKQTVAKCYIKNEASFKMLTKSGFKKIREDNKFFYFIG